MNKEMNGPDSIYDHIAFSSVAVSAIFISIAFLCERESFFFWVNEKRDIERDLLIIQKTEIYTIFTINN